MIRQVNPIRLAIIVSHPIQYYVPLYRRLEQRADIQIKVFFTWHGAREPVFDRGFKQAVAWDIPLTEGYESEVVPNLASDPGTHHFTGLRNPSLMQRVLDWQPDAVHLTGYAYDSHLKAMRACQRRQIPLLFRGDSHLLDGRNGWKWNLKRAFLKQVFKWPAAFLYVGQANRAYYQTFGVPDTKLFYCPHTIEVSRFTSPDAEWCLRARQWRLELGLTERQRVLLFAGKFESKKQPVALMQAFLDAADQDQVLVMVGGGELAPQINALATRHPNRFRILPFQNQSQMPLVYRLGDLLVLPSGYGETWGLAVNEALACGQPVLVSDRVGCAADLVKSGQTGEIFCASDWNDFKRKLKTCMNLVNSGTRSARIEFANQFDIAVTEHCLMDALISILNKRSKNP